jgi:hypothetical protein
MVGFRKGDFGECSKVNVRDVPNKNEMVTC